MEAGPLNARLKRKLADLGKALSEAISGSSDASRQLSELRREGYSVYLLLESDGDRTARNGERTARNDERTARNDERAEAGRADGAHALSAQRQLSGRQLDGQRQLVGQLDSRGRLPGDGRVQAAPPPEPAFLIDGRDLAFLKSVGIDPTRSPRRKRS